MAPVTEIASITLKPGINVNDKTSEAYQVWQEILRTLSPLDGMLGQRYGQSVEDPTLLQLVIDWDTIESHKKFMASPEYGPFSAKLGSILTGIEVHHSKPRPFPPTILDSSPVTEVATLFDVNNSVDDNIGKFLEAIKGAEGNLGGSHGPTVEEISQEAGSKSAKAAVLFIGWESRDLHLKFRESDLFKDNIHLLRAGVGGIEMHHVAFTRV